jgi:asparagine synthetase B (glutamine-hydrolysing)
VEPSRSFTWKFEAESFKPEVEYAKEASALLGTQHVYLDIYAREYPNLLTRTIETLAQPNIFVENCPGELALTEFLSANYPERQYIFFGQGADGFHGLLYAPRAAIYSVLKNSVLNNIVESAFTVLSPIRERKLQGLLGSLAIMLRKETYHGLFGPKTILDPIDRVGITFYIMEIIRHYWGDTVLKEALEYVCNLAAKCYHSGTMLEKLQSIDIVTFEYDPTVVAASLASTNRKVLIPFYFDQEVIRLAMNFTPDIRYLHKGVTKPILKAILTQKSLEKLAQKKKLWSGFNADLCKWMRSGVLKEMVHSIERPNFMNKKDFNDLIENKHPDSCELLWPLLTYDIFQKCISTTYSRKGH